MKKFLTAVFYGGIALAGTLSFLVFLYWGLRADSNLASLFANTAGEPLYFWTYATLTFAAALIFGVNLAALTWRWRAWGPPKLRQQAGAGIGPLIGFAASACPVCGSTLLATVGIAGGLAAFPLGGLELKTLSLALIALPLILLLRDQKTLGKQCAEGICPAPKDASYDEKDGALLGTILLVIMIMPLVGWNMLKTDPIMGPAYAARSAVHAPIANGTIEELVAKVLPAGGWQSKISFGDSIRKLTEYGVIDRAKFEELYAGRGGLPQDIRRLLDDPSREPMLLTHETAHYYLNFLWPLGLSNRMQINERSALNGPSLFRFASTGGWTLGREPNGGAYFNKFDIVPLSAEQEALVKRIAENAYRPCCDNSTFFQDCNHGSALLGLLELGASQGLSEDELWKEALAFNSFWFPENYLKTALYFKTAENIDWENVDPKTIMGKTYSSASGWYANVERRLQESGVSLPLQQSGGCGV